MNSKIEEIKEKLFEIMGLELPVDVNDNYFKIISLIEPHLKSEKDKLKIDLASMILNDGITKDIEFKSIDDYRAFGIIYNKIKELENENPR